MAARRRPRLLDVRARRAQGGGRGRGRPPPSRASARRGRCRCGPRRAARATSTWRRGRRARPAARRRRCRPAPRRCRSSSATSATVRAMGDDLRARVAERADRPFVVDHAGDRDAARGRLERGQPAEVRGQPDARARVGAEPAGRAARRDDRGLAAAAAARACGRGRRGCSCGRRPGCRSRCRRPMAGSSSCRAGSRPPPAAGRPRSRRVAGDDRDALGHADRHREAGGLEVVLRRERHAVQRPGGLAAGHGGVRGARLGEGALGSERHDRVERAVDLRDPREMRCDDLLGRRLAAGDDGRQRRGRHAGELGRARHGANPIPRSGDPGPGEPRMDTVERRCGYP